MIEVFPPYNDCESTVVKINVDGGLPFFLYCGERVALLEVIYSKDDE